MCTAVGQQWGKRGANIGNSKTKTIYFILVNCLIRARGFTENFNFSLDYLYAIEIVMWNLPSKTLEF